MRHCDINLRNVLNAFNSGEISREEPAGPRPEVNYGPSRPPQSILLTETPPTAKMEFLLEYRKEI
jgi:hypothetical protein